MTSSMQELPSWPEPRRSRVRQKLAIALGVMTARLHDAGFLHVDFHPGNLLVRFPTPDEPELVMIDLDALRRRRHVDWKAARQNLALLNHFFWLRSSRTDRLRFLDHYRRHRQGPVEDVAPGRAADRRRDAGLGRTALAPLGPALPLLEQVLRGRDRRATPGAWPRATWTPARSGG